MSKKTQQKKGFTLIELIIVMVLIAILAAATTSTFFASLKKGRDARRKTDIAEMQKAVENYYEDKQIYPTSMPFGSKFCENNPCNNSDKVYMQRVPNDPVSSRNYVYVSDGTFYKIYSCMENDQDASQGVKLTGTVPDPNGYGGTNCACNNITTCKYGIASPNTNP